MRDIVFQTITAINLFSLLFFLSFSPFLFFLCSPFFSFSILLSPSFHFLFFSPVFFCPFLHSFPFVLSSFSFFSSFSFLPYSSPFLSFSTFFFSPFCISLVFPSFSFRSSLLFSHFLLLPSLTFPFLLRWPVPTAAQTHLTFLRREKRSPLPTEALRGSKFWSRIEGISTSLPLHGWARHKAARSQT